MISIVIPTRNRGSSLKVCLAALHREKNGIGEHEVIVVDDGSTSEERRRNQRCCEHFQARYVLLERGHGMAVARNTGLRVAQGEWVVFLDDDVTVDNGWGSVLVAVLGKAAPDVVGIEGKVAGLGGGLWDREVEVTAGGACLTCHICYRRSVLLDAGGFDGHFEFEGPFHEDQELAARMQRRGRIMFAAGLVAFHQPRKNPLFSYVTLAPQRIKQVLRADFYFWNKDPEGYSHFRHAKTFKGTYMAVLLKYTWITLRRRQAASLVRHPLQAAVLLVSCCVAQLHAWQLLPYFIARARGGARKREVWFAAAIPDNSQGGVRRLMGELARGIETHGYRPVVICREYRKGGYPLFSLMLAVRLLRRLFNPPACIIARSTDAFYPLLLRRVLPLSTKIILQNHGWEEYVYEVQRRLSSSIIGNPVSWKAHLVRFPLLRATLRMADYCLCGTVADMRWITRRYPLQRTKVRYVPNGVDIPDNGRSNSDTSFVFLSVGTFTWRKNHPYTFAVFKRIVAAQARAHLYCVGTGKVPEDDHNGSITFIPSVPMNEMGSWYRRCPFFIHTSRYEGGHALALLEAMAHGAVCFVSPEPANLEVVVHGRNGIVLDGCDHGKDASRILDVMNDQQSCAELSAGAIKTAGRHRWERQTRRLLRVLEPEENLL
ncbi:MAG: glycosyltransferase [Chitinispirillaceae bacterium]|nr:glycosyltransferase [Chitinispirillaceae bacterium]